MPTVPENMGSLPAGPAEEQWLTPKEICSLLQIPEQTFYQWRVKHGGPRAHRIGRHLRISRSDFDAWLASTEDDFE